jgi:hypothetical protein
VNQKRASSLATLIVGLIILIGPAIQTLPILQQPEAVCDTRRSDDDSALPRILFPRTGTSMADSDTLLFHLPPVEGATEYQWQIEHNGYRIAEIDQRVPPPGIKRFVSELFGTWALAEEMSRAPSHQAVELIDELAGPDLEIVPAQLPEWRSPATLTVLVRARRCGDWRPIDSTDVEIR